MKESPAFEEMAMPGILKSISRCRFLLYSLRCCHLDRQFEEQAEECLRIASAGFVRVRQKSIPFQTHSFFLLFSEVYCNLKVSRRYSEQAV